MGLSSTHEQPATSWPGSSPCRALHQYCKGQGSGIPIQAYSLAIICLVLKDIHSKLKKTKAYMYNHRPMCNFS